MGGRYIYLSLLSTSPAKNVLFLHTQMYCCLWLRCLQWKQKHFLKNIKPRLDEEQRSTDETDSETSTVKIEASVIHVVEY